MELELILDAEVDLYFKPKQLDESKCMYFDLEPGSVAGDVCDKGGLSGEDVVSKFL